LTIKSIKKPKPTLDSLLAESQVLTGKQVIQKIKEQEKRQKEFEKSVEDEMRNRRSR
jgi:hypothetical protein